MAQAVKDANLVNTLIALLNTDGATPVRVQANPTTHRLSVNDSAAGSDAGGDHAINDANSVPVALVVSEVDDVTPVALYANSSGALLIDSK